MPRAPSVPDMGAVKIPEYRCRQSRFPHAPPLPVLGLCVGPSMSGKTNFLVKLITEVYRHKDDRSCFDRIYVFSPSVNHDPMWKPVRDMIESEILDPLNPNHRNEQAFFDEPDFAAMERIIDEQFAIIQLSRQKKRKDEVSILLVIDDFSAEPEMTRQDSLVNKLYTRGRHTRFSTITSGHKTKRGAVYTTTDNVIWHKFANGSLSYVGVVGLTSSGAVHEQRLDVVSCQKSEIWLTELETL